jgi:hypothetical protein
MNEQSPVPPAFVSPTDATPLRTRLPCRGCDDSCKNYEICDGRPWRTLDPRNTIPPRHAS